MDELVKFLDDNGFNDDSLPDGAWQAMLEDGVKEYNRKNGTRYDPFDGFMYYIKNKK